MFHGFCANLKHLATNLYVESHDLLDLKRPLQFEKVPLFLIVTFAPIASYEEKSAFKAETLRSNGFF